jgi:DNA-directed RNA polymerase specialized sigma24 family protein
VGAPATNPDRFDLLAIRDEEIGRHPESRRAAVIPCDLEILPQKELSRWLGCPIGPVESRLSHCRQRLGDLLVRRGLVPAAATM